MKKSLHILVLALLLTSWTSAGARLIGTEIYPTEDELFEAYMNGEIDYETYLNLRDIYDFGIDSTEQYLLEEIPNVIPYPGTDAEEYTELEPAQPEPYGQKERRLMQGPVSGSVKWKRYQHFDADNADQNRIYISSRLSSDWTFKAGGLDNYDGRQEWSYRSLRYNGRRGTIKKLAIGNYTARFGLGLTVGFRGRLINKDYLSADETAFYPDYGGFNGLYAEGGQTRDNLKWMLHYDQNDTLRVRVTALDFIKKFGRYRLEGIVLGSILNNRPANIEYKHYQFGLLLGYSDPEFDAAVEVAIPKNATNALQAMVLESSYKKDFINLWLTAWHYDSDFVNLFGGARAGDMYRTVELDTVGLKFRDRRNNQQGILLKTSTTLSEASRCDMSFSIYGSSRYYRSIEMQAIWDQLVGKDTHLRFYYEHFRKEKDIDISNDDIFKLEYLLRSPNFSLRSYLGYRYNNSDERFLAHFWRLRLKGPIFRQLELWLNLGRLSLETGNIDYFYGYVREAINLTATMNLGVKYRYSFNRRYNDREDTEIYLETTVVW